jgi:tRNA A37 threonylcarbamoyladenosine biosynthesis protein TsaE
VADELREVAGDPKIVTAIEWAGNAGGALPAERVRIEITPTGEETRDITVTALGPKFNYVVEALNGSSN